MIPRLATTIRLTAVLALGLATSVGVAVLGAVRGGPLAMQGKLTDSIAVVLPDGTTAVTFAHRRMSWCIDEAMMVRGNASLISADRVHVPWGGWGGQIDARRVPALPRDCHPPEGRANERSEYRTGWPFRCLWAAVDADHAGDVVRWTGQPHLLRVWPVADPGVNGLQEAVMPFDHFRGSICRFADEHLPIGLVLDSITYAAAWGLLLAMPGHVRRSIRLRRHHCPHCNYDLRATPPASPCPECGSVSPRKLLP